MSKELVISSNRHETKLAVLEDDQVVELFFQRANEYSLAGSIHKGRVTRVLPGMQSAFVDLGLERDTFLYVSDFAEDHHDEDLDKVIDDGHSGQVRGELPGETRAEARGPREERGPSSERPPREGGPREGGPREGGSRDRGPRGRDRGPRGRRDDRHGRREDRPATRVAGQTGDGPYSVETVEPAQLEAPEEFGQAPVETIILEGERLSGGRYSQNRGAASGGHSQAAEQPDGEKAASEQPREYQARESQSEDRAPRSREGNASGEGEGGRGFDKGGRRGRRRRGNGGNLPEAKYASPTDEVASDEAGDAPISEGIVALEGEVLQKHRGQAPASDAPQDRGQERGQGRSEGRGEGRGQGRGGRDRDRGRGGRNRDQGRSFSDRPSHQEAPPKVAADVDAISDEDLPGSPTPAPEEDRVVTASPVIEQADAEDVVVPEVILLPGESLAKYRNRGADGAPAPSAAPVEESRGESRFGRGGEGRGGDSRGGRDRGGRGGRDRGRGGRDRGPREGGSREGGRGRFERGPRTDRPAETAGTASTIAADGDNLPEVPTQPIAETLAGVNAQAIENTEITASAQVPAQDFISPEPPPFFEPPTHHVEPPAVIHQVSHHTEVDGEAVPYATVPASVDPAEVEEADAIDEAREELLTGSDEEMDEIDEAQAAAEAAVAAEARGEISPLLDAGEESDEADSEQDGEEDGEEDDDEIALSADGTAEGPEPARQPQSLTATLRERERSSRFQRDRGRRGRRRRGPRERVSDIDKPMDDAKSADAGEEEFPAFDARAEEQGEPNAEVQGESRRPQGGRSREERPREGRSGERGSDRGGDRRGGRPGGRGFHRERPPLPQITDLLKAGQEIVVQIAKEPIGQKGARITSHIALPGRYCVYMPTVDHNGVSRKIASDQERLRLKRILQAHRQGMPGGFIIRTAGEGCTEEEISSDMHFLHNMWVDIRTKSERRPAPALIHHDLDIVQRTLRDQLTEDFKAIWLDNEELYESTVNFIERFQPNLVGKVKLWTRPVPIFDAFNITAELEKALRSKVWLKSGGYIVINQTEALVAVDVNTGKFVGKSNRLEDTIVKTNIEAVKEIVRQIRLRDLGGIIVVDFIDMDERKNRQKVMQALEEAMQVDRAPYKILQFNDFGLVAITRKRVKQSLERSLCMPCVYCEGAGYVKSVPTVISEILHDAAKLARGIDDKEVMLRVHPEVAKALKSSKNQYLEELETIFKRPVLVTGDASVHIEKYVLA